MSKLAVIGVPLHGHVKPVLPLLAALRQDSFEVDYYNTDSFEGMVRATGCRFRPYRSLLESYRYVHPALIFLHREIPEVLAQLQQPLLQEGYDAVLYDSFCLWAKYLATSHSIPQLCLHTTYPGLLSPKQIPDSSASIELNDENLLYIQRNSLEPYTTVATEEKLIKLERLQMLTDTLRFCKLKDARRVRAQNLLHTPAPANLVFMLPDFVTPDQATHERACFVGSLYRPEARTIHDSNKVYASFGTRSRDIASLLSAWNRPTTKHPFHLYVSGGADAQQLQGFKSEHITIEPYVDQLDVLRQSCAFITHGGMNGVIEAILTETPMLVIPLTVEQQTTAKQVVEHRLGIQYTLEELTKINLQERIETLRRNQEIKKKLANFRQKIIDAGGITRATEVIRQQIKSRSLTP
jgi:MGT family glycosyltransferase